MNIGRNITRLQNKDKNLDFLAAQRSLYSHAKLLFGIQAVAVGVPVLFVFLSLAFQPLQEFNAIFSVIFLLLDLRFLEKAIKANQKRGAELQEMFDCAVFGLPWPSWFVPNPPSADFVAKRSMAWKKKFSAKELTDWYDPAIVQVKDYRAILICQWQNVSYSLELRTGMSLILECLWISIPILFIVYCALENMEVASSILLFVPLIPLERWLIKEDMRHSGYMEAGKSLKNYVESLLQGMKKGFRDNREALAALRSIQDRILEHRGVGPLIFDWFYWRSRVRNEGIYHDALVALVKNKRGIK